MAKKHNNLYFDAFSRGIDFGKQASVLLVSCMENYNAASLESRLAEMHAIEHTADGVKHEMMEQLVKEFLPPIEREDIVELAHVIDDVTDCVEDILRRLYMYNVTALRDDVQEFTALIARCCGVLAEMVGELPNFRKSSILRDKIIEINNMEEEGDRLYTKAMRRLYLEESDPVTVLTWTTMYDRLEKCCDCCEHVADVVEQVVLKNC